MHALGTPEAGVVPVAVLIVHLLETKQKGWASVSDTGVLRGGQGPTPEMISPLTPGDALL